MFLATFAEKTVYSFRDALASLTALGSPIVAEFYQANSLMVPLGAEPARGYLLMRREDLDTIDLNALHTLTFTLIHDATGTVLETISWKSLVICKEPLNLTPSHIAADVNSLYLVEISDCVWRVKNPLFCAPLDMTFNIVDPVLSQSRGTATYYASSTYDTDIPWTWTTMIQEIWTEMVGVLGAFPDLPTGMTPTLWDEVTDYIVGDIISHEGIEYLCVADHLDEEPPHDDFWALAPVPESFVFQGVCAWDALSEALAHIGCAVKRDLVQADGSQCSIVKIGAADTPTDDFLAQADETNLKVHDGEPLAIARGKVPYGVRVFFQKLKDTDLSVPLSPYTVDVLSPDTTGAEAGIYHPLWDDMLAVYHSDGTLLNELALAARAQVRSDNYFRMIRSIGGTRLWKRYSGLLDAVPGATIKSVAWRCTRTAQNEEEVFTEILRHAQHLQPPRNVEQKETTTTICIRDCNSVEYCLTVPRSWLALNVDGLCAGGGGVGNACAACTGSPLNQLCVVFPGVMDGGCTGCNQFTVPLTLTYQEAGGFCNWIYNYIGFSGCGPSLYGSIPAIVLESTSTNYWVLTVQPGSEYALIEIYYTASQAWDCRSPLQMIRAGGASGLRCGNWPVAIIVQPCGVGIPPTIDFNSPDLCNDATTINITGTGFDTATPANNLLTFNLGATGTCTAASSSASLTATVTLSSLGALTCIVQNANGISTPAVQVATVVACASTVWQDTFTGANGTLLTAHTGETTPGGYANFNGGMQLQSNKAVNVSADDDFGLYFFLSVTTYTFAFKFMLAPSSQDAGVREMYAYVRLGANWFRVIVSVGAGADSTGSFIIQKNLFGSLATSATGVTTINTDTEYACTIVVTPTSVAATINAVTATAADLSFSGNTGLGLAFKATFWSSSKPYFDDILVTN